MELRLFSNKNEIIKTIDDIQALFGPNGEHWGQGEYKESVREYDPDTDSYGAVFTKFCLSGALREVDGPSEFAAYAAITQAIREKTDQGSLSEVELAEQLFDCHYRAEDDDLKRVIELYSSGDVIDLNGDATIVNYNDGGQRTWSDIVAVLDRAREIVREAKY